MQQYTLDLNVMSAVKFFQPKLICKDIKHKVVHTAEKPYKCNDCDNFFSSKGNVLGHMKIHTDKRPFKCNVCKKLFSQEENLNVYMRIHTGEKPYRCNIC